MMAEGRGRVITISSIVASTGFNALSVYAATKASLVGFTKSLAREVGRVGVNVNAISPGFIDTEMTHGLEESERERVIGRSALRRLAAPEDIAAMAAFLMGEGGRNITGAVMTVDAGANGVGVPTNRYELSIPPEYGALSVQPAACNLGTSVCNCLGHSRLEANMSSGRRRLQTGSSLKGVGKSQFGGGSAVAQGGSRLA